MLPPTACHCGLDPRSHLNRVNRAPGGLRTRPLRRLRLMRQSASHLPDSRNSRSRIKLALCIEQLMQRRSRCEALTITLLIFL